jgi:hypothetical protein
MLLSKQFRKKNSDGVHPFLCLVSTPIPLSSDIARSRLEHFPMGILVTTISLLKGFTASMVVVVIF